MFGLTHTCASQSILRIISIVHRFLGGCFLVRKRNLSTTVSLSFLLHSRKGTNINTVPVAEL